jgi:DNA-directed RNA polymerase III subunit RPC6
MVYGLIDECGAEGIWSKTIKTRLNMHETTMKAAIKQLEIKRLITDMKSVEHMSRKMYIKASLTPSERATGGPWYTDGELDSEFISQIMESLYSHILNKSFSKTSGTSRRLTKKVKTGSEKATNRNTVAQVKAARDAALQQPSIHVKLEEEDPMNPLTMMPRVDWARQLPHPAGYQEYPTLSYLTLWVENSKMCNTTLSSDDIQQLLDILCFDNRIVKVYSGGEGVAYKALRKTTLEIEEGPMNGLTEAPCGRCPVFDLCEEGGPVGPSNCEYFKAWLGVEGW